MIVQSLRIFWVWKIQVLIISFCLDYNILLISNCRKLRWLLTSRGWNMCIYFSTNPPDLSTNQHCSSLVLAATIHNVLNSLIHRRQNKRNARYKQLVLKTRRKEQWKTNHELLVLNTGRKETWKLNHKLLSLKTRMKEKRRASHKLLALKTRRKEKQITSQKLLALKIRRTCLKD